MCTLHANSARQALVKMCNLPLLAGENVSAACRADRRDMRGSRRRHFFYEIGEAAGLLRFFREFIKDAPENYGAFPAFQVAPPLPFIPEDRHGDTFCAAIVHWAGPLDEGEQAMAPFRDLAPRVGEMVGPMPYPALNAAFDGLFPKGMRSYWKGSYVTELTDAAIEAHLSHGPNVPGVSATMHLYPINGAASRVGSDETAFAYRGATFAPVIVAAWEDHADDQARIQWVRQYYEGHRAALRGRRLHQLHVRRRSGPCPGQRRRELPTAGRGQAGLGSGKPLSPQPKHQTISAGCLGAAHPALRC